MMSLKSTSVSSEPRKKDSRQIWSMFRPLLDSGILKTMICEEHMGTSELYSNLIIWVPIYIPS